VTTLSAGVRQATIAAERASLGSVLSIRLGLTRFDGHPPCGA
jgi:hypothetical protein